MKNKQYQYHTLHIVNDHNAKGVTDDDLLIFEYLYDKYASKAYGFIIRNTDNKEQADQLMINVFLKVWADIKSFNIEPMKKIQSIVLCEYRAMCFANKGLPKQ